MQALATDKQADNKLKRKSWTLHPYSEGISWLRSAVPSKATCTLRRKGCCKSLLSYDNISILMGAVSSRMITLLSKGYKGSLSGLRRLNMMRIKHYGLQSQQILIQFNPKFNITAIEQLTPSKATAYKSVCIL